MDDAEEGGGSDGEEKDGGTKANGGRRSRSGRAWNDGELSTLRAQWSEPLVRASEQRASEPASQRASEQERLAKQERLAREADLGGKKAIF
ncbi:predicted protein [Verticillium alfalfae VaMs.102]|uniref:Predicted protein n=1 Tax=Verticillium alfalfae (strain VaMs.102 / ATCC MYA-4576 / FGSC 10136) TaxID=526221 RepID=C9S9F0_VERA1|nr:predicted protein [Verticillium alfalfae VaMs.102]EEY16013.1 predicted protein [Verticillium alfalfae VaMs.102]